MGNQQTKPAQPELQKKVVNPPEDWQDGNEFNLISPMSDLSNPSQFRHRLPNGGIKQRGARNSSRNGSQARRQTQRRTNGVPAPSTFYFDQAEVKGKENSGSNWIESKHRAVKKRATKARRVLTGCLNDKKGIFDGCLVGGDNKQVEDVHHAHLPSVSPAQERDNVVMVEQNMLHDTPQVALPQIEEETPQMILAQDTPQLILPTVNIINPILQTEEKDVADSRYDGIKAYIHDEEVFVNRIAEDAPNETPLGSHESRASLTNPSSGDETPQRDGEAVDDLAQKFFECQPFPLRLRESPPESSPVTETQSIVSGMSQEMINAELQKAVSEAIAKQPEGFSPYGESEYAEEASMQEEEVVQVMNIRPPSMESQERQPLGKLHSDSLSTDKGSNKETTEELRTSDECTKLSSTVEAKHDKQFEPIEQKKQLKQHALKMAGKKVAVDDESPESKNEVPPSGNVTKYFSGSSMTQMLLQTYQIMDNTDESFDMETPQKPSMAPLESPAASEATVDTPLSTSSKQTVSRQAIQNATFLFSPSYADGDQSLLKLPAPHKGATPFAISTADSRSRLGAQSRPNPLEYGNDAADDHSASTQSVSTAITRRVRFSDLEEPAPVFEPVAKPAETAQEDTDDINIATKEVEFHPIQRNFSDITEATGLESIRESLVTIPSAPPSVTPIPEESVCDEDPDADTTASETELEDGIEHISVENTVSTVPSAEATVEDDEESKQSSGSQYPTNWYSTNMDNGVTPLRSGKSVANATNSPYIRFNAAQKRFSGKMKKSPAKKSPLQKRKSPTRISGGLVKSRILAFQGGSNNSQQSVEQRAQVTSSTLTVPASPVSVKTNNDDEGVVSESPWRPPVENTASFGITSTDSSSRRASTSSATEITEAPIQKKVSFGATSTISRSSSSPVSILRESEKVYSLPNRVSSQSASLTPGPRQSTVSESSQSVVSVKSRNYESGMDTSVDDFAAILRGGKCALILLTMNSNNAGFSSHVCFIFQTTKKKTRKTTALIKKMAILFPPCVNWTVS